MRCIKSAVSQYWSYPFSYSIQVGGGFDEEGSCGMGFGVGVCWTVVCSYHTAVSSKQMWEQEFSFVP